MKKFKCDKLGICFKFDDIVSIEYGIDPSVVCDDGEEGVSTVSGGDNRSTLSINWMRDKERHNMYLYGKSDEAVVAAYNKLSKY